MKNSNNERYEKFGGFSAEHPETFIVEYDILDVTDFKENTTYAII
ncbi:hypothetical protein [Neobacillus soli]|nr:hypothetical protein [Neobacillus soli]